MEGRMNNYKHHLVEMNPKPGLMPHGRRKPLGVNVVAFRNWIKQHQAVRPFNKKLPMLSNANRPSPTKVESGVNWRTLYVIVFEVGSEEHGFYPCEIMGFIFGRIAHMQGNINGNGVEVEAPFTNVVFHKLQSIA